MQYDYSLPMEIAVRWWYGTPCASHGNLKLLVGSSNDFQKILVSTTNVLPTYELLIFVVLPLWCVHREFWTRSSTWPRTDEAAMMLVFNKAAFRKLLEMVQKLFVWYLLLFLQDIVTKP